MRTGFEEEKTVKASPVTQEFVTLGSLIFEGAGLKRSTEELMGLLYAHSKPLTLRQIGEVLSLSKATVSVGVRELTDYGLIRRVWEPGSRGDLYLVEEDLVGSVKNFFVSTVLTRIEPLLSRLDGVDERVSESLASDNLPPEESKFLAMRAKNLREAKKKARILRFVFSKFTQ